MNAPFSRSPSPPALAALAAEGPGSPVSALAAQPGPVASAPIGVFDSGLGGLSVLRAIRAALPAEHLLYAADSAHAPYGDRTADYIEARVLAMSRFLREQGAKAIVVACNTATVVAIDRLRGLVDVPIVAMEPAIKPAVALTRTGVVGVLATRQTLASASVARLCERYGQGVRLVLQPCPGWVERVEAGDLDGPVTQALLAQHLEPVLAAGADTLVLGCTHYPFLLPLLQRLAGPGVTVVESSAAVARELVRRLGGNVQGQRAPPLGETRFFTTADPALAQVRMAALWGEPVQVGAVVPAGPTEAPANVPATAPL